MMLEQTRDVVTRMKAAGVPRSRYSVRTQKARYGEYRDDPQIVSYMSVDDFLEYLPGVIEAGFGVTLYYFIGLIRGYAIDCRPVEGRSRLWIDDLDARRYVSAREHLRRLGDNEVK